MKKISRLGYIYFHRDLKKLIWKHAHYEFEGDLVQKVWPIHSKADAQEALMEGKDMGAVNWASLWEEWGFNDSEEQ